MLNPQARSDIMTLFLQLQEEFEYAHFSKGKDFITVHTDSLFYDDEQDCMVEVFDEGQICRPLIKTLSNIEYLAHVEIRSGQIIIKSPTEEECYEYLPENTVTKFGEAEITGDNWFNSLMGEYYKAANPELFDADNFKKMYQGDFEDGSFPSFKPTVMLDAEDELRAKEEIIKGFGQGHGSTPYITERTISNNKNHPISDETLKSVKDRIYSGIQNINFGHHKPNSAWSSDDNEEAS